MSKSRRAALAAAFVVVAVAGYLGGRVYHNRVVQQEVAAPTPTGVERTKPLVATTGDGEVVMVKPDNLHEVITDAVGPLYEENKKLRDELTAVKNRQYVLDTGGVTEKVRKRIQDRFALSPPAAAPPAPSAPAPQSPVRTVPPTSRLEPAPAPPAQVPQLQIVPRLQAAPAPAPEVQTAPRPQPAPPLITKGQADPEAQAPKWDMCTGNFSWKQGFKDESLCGKEIKKGEVSLRR